MAGQAKRIDNISLPTYPILADPNFTQYVRNLTTNLQWWADQATQAIDNGLVPYQSITIGQSVAPGATGIVFTFALPLPVGTSYSAIPTTHWNAGGTWVSPTSTSSCQINWNTAPATTATIDLLIYFSQLLP